MFRPFAVLAGAALIALVFSDVFGLMLLPRRSRRAHRFARLCFRAGWRGWRAVGDRIESPQRREDFLAAFGPLMQVTLIGLWVWILVAGFGLLHWVADAMPATGPALGRALYMSGAAFFGISYTDVMPHSRFGRTLGVVEAGCGLAMLAVVIGYLPVLYQLFSRRETDILRLDARAGSPPAAATLLCRYGEGGRLDALDGLLIEWEKWASELLESHMSYPMLGFYRSQQRNECWLSTLAVVLDSCALLLVGFEGVNPFRARLTFSTARLAMTELSDVFADGPVDQRLRVEEERLSRPELARMRLDLAAAGLVFSAGTALQRSESGFIPPLTHDEVGLRLAEFRATYETHALAIQRYLRLPDIPWVGREGQLDNWQRGPGAQMVKRLAERSGGGR